VRKLVKITEVGKFWFKNPAEENGFFDLLSYNPRTGRYSFNKLSDSNLLKRVAFNHGWSVKKCLSNIKLRGKIIRLIVKQSSKDSSLLNPEKIIDFNSFFSHLINNYDSKTIISKFRSLINSSQLDSPDFRDNLIVNSLFELKAFNKKTSVSTILLFKSLGSKVSRPTFNKLLNSLESESVIRVVKHGSVRKWWLPKRVFKFLKS
jgi:hypothetical protein